METTAETQMENQPFGVTPWTQSRDGNTVTQLYSALDAMKAGLLVQTDEHANEPPAEHQAKKCALVISALATEEHRQLPPVDTNVWIGRIQA